MAHSPNTSPSPPPPSKASPKKLQWLAVLCSEFDEQLLLFLTHTTLPLSAGKESYPYSADLKSQSVAALECDRGQLANNNYCASFPFPMGALSTPLMLPVGALSASFLSNFPTKLDTSLTSPWLSVYARYF